MTFTLTSVEEKKHSLILIGSVKLTLLITFLTCGIYLLVKLIEIFLRTYCLLDYFLHAFLLCMRFSRVLQDLDMFLAL